MYEMTQKRRIRRTGRIEEERSERKARDPNVHRNIRWHHAMNVNIPLLARTASWGRTYHTEDEIHVYRSFALGAKYMKNTSPCPMPA
jgi:hypothetical protein